MTFSRTGDPATGEFGEAEVIAVYGAVDVGMLARIEWTFQLPTRIGAVQHTAAYEAAHVFPLVYDRDARH